ncbi:MAG: hypothetical protein AAFS07_19520, partial [Pseudomonadota bacterium]
VWNSTTLALLIAEGGAGIYFAFRRAIGPAIVQLLLFIVVSTFRANLRQNFESRQAVLTYVQAIKKDEQEREAASDACQCSAAAADAERAEAKQSQVDEAEELDYEQPGRQAALQAKEKQLQAAKGLGEEEAGAAGHSAGGAQSSSSAASSGAWLRRVFHKTRTHGPAGSPG